MTRFYDKGTYVKIVVGGEVYRVPKNQVTVTSDNPEGDGILHVELLGASLGL